jgi:hypothetical protein
VESHITVSFRFVWSLFVWSCVSFSLLIPLKYNFPGTDAFHDSHSQTGIMRDGWDESQLIRASTRSLNFTPEESALIRRTVAEITISSARAAADRTR